MTTYLSNELRGGVNPASRTEQVGIWAQRGTDSPIALDTDLGFVFKFLTPTTQGSIRLVQIDGNTMTIPVAIPGVWYPVWGTQVLSSGTTATDIFWYTGE